VFNLLFVNLLLYGASLRIGYGENRPLLFQKSTDQKGVLVTTKIDFGLRKLLKLEFRGREELESLESLVLLVHDDNLKSK
jgi:hypothetical protein